MVVMTRRYDGIFRFLADGSEAEGEEKQLWNLPLLYSTASDPKETKLEMMSGETHTLKVCVCGGKSKKWEMVFDIIRTMSCRHVSGKRRGATQYDTYTLSRSVEKR